MSVFLEFLEDYLRHGYMHHLYFVLRISNGTSLTISSQLIVIFDIPRNESGIDNLAS